MGDVGLRKMALWVAAFAGAVALASIVLVPLRSAVPPAIAVTSGVAALLFLRMLFSRTYRKGVDLANLEMKGDDPWPGRSISFWDREWGIFGSEAGGSALLWVRAVLMLGLLPLMFMHRWVGTGAVVLWWCATFVAMELSLMHMALQAHSRQG